MDTPVRVNGMSSPCKCVLLVEDEVLVRMATAESLRDEGYQVVEAADGDEALRLLHNDNQVDVVLSDIRMPGSLDGLALADRIASLWPSMPVALVSSHMPPEAIWSSDRFLRKPYQRETLLEMIEKLVSDAWMEKPNQQSAS